MNTLRSELYRQRESECEGSLLAAPTGRPCSPPLIGPHPLNEESAALRRLKRRIHRFFAQLTRES